MPKQTPPQVIDRLASEINAGLADARVRTRLGELGGTPLAGSPADFAKLIAEQTERWATVIRAPNIRPD